MTLSPTPLIAESTWTAAAWGVPINNRDPDYFGATKECSDARLYLFSGSAQTSPSSLCALIASKWSRWPSFFGIRANDQLPWKQHVTTTVRSAAYRLYMIPRLKSLGTPADKLREIYFTFILPTLMYSMPPRSFQQQQLENVPKRASILRPAYTNYDDALATLCLPSCLPDTERLWRNLEGICCASHAYATYSPIDAPLLFRATRD
ncbi:hypothetical protein E2C01_021591 [Portunus trituberculatus]|uniref:Uncharacterized protein n=1 Tax=Portunus trituberculatus TaxID=210409 RepID=A0A5B7E3Q2_PORTR|nr:hypothetical protein [Portunus trituberculatus]